MLKSKGTSQSYAAKKRPRAETEDHVSIEICSKQRAKEKKIKIKRQLEEPTQRRVEAATC